jgi:hypothetical protein
MLITSELFLGLRGVNIRRGSIRYIIEQSDHIRRIARRWNGSDIGGGCSSTRG